MDKDKKTLEEIIDNVIESIEDDEDIELYEEDDENETASDTPYHKSGKTQTILHLLKIIGNVIKRVLTTIFSVLMHLFKTMGKPVQIILIIVVILSIIGFTGFRLGWFERMPLLIDKTNNIVTEINKIGQYTTSYVVEELVLKETRIDTTSIAGINIYNKNEIVLIGKGSISAGFDLSKIRKDDVRFYHDTLFLTLPPAEIFDIIMNPSDFETVYEQGVWSHELTKSLKTGAVHRLMEEIERLQMLQKAEQKGAIRLASLFKNFGYNTVVIDIKHELTYNKH